MSLCTLEIDQGKISASSPDHFFEFFPNFFENPCDHCDLAFHLLE